MFIPGSEAKLTPWELQLFYSIAEACRSISNLDEFKRMIESLVLQFLPHEWAACGIGGRFDRQVFHLININFPEDYLATVIRNGKVFSSPVAKAWTRDPITPQQVNKDNICRFRDPEWHKSFYEYDLRNLTAHGLVDLAGYKVSYFCFARSPEALLTHHRDLVELIVPHLHLALAKVIFQKQVCPDRHFLTRREAEILKWLYSGKTNCEIGMILGISEFTVKNHVAKILTKLNVCNRTQAATKAVRYDLI